MWIFYAIGSSFFAGITAILAKCGIKKFECGNSDPDCGGIVVFVAYGADHRNMGRNHADRWQDAFVFDLIRYGDRRIVAVLFPCPSERRH